MTQNEQSAEALRAWLETQQEMLNKTVEQRDRLISLKPQGNERIWMDEAIENAQASIDHLTQSMDLTRKLIQLADNNQLHDPARG